MSDPISKTKLLHDSLKVEGSLLSLTHFLATSKSCPELSKLVLADVREIRALALDVVNGIKVQK